MTGRVAVKKCCIEIALVPTALSGCPDPPRKQSSDRHSIEQQLVPTALSGCPDPPTKQSPDRHSIEQQLQ